MYNIGTVTTTANSTKLIGTGTKWKENINLVLPMQMIQIQIGNTVHNNSIHSIQSNTELTLNFPLPTAQAGAKYVIFTTTMDSISAAANAIVAMNVSNVQFSDIQNRIMTETGVIDVKLPDGTTRKTRTEAERDKLLDGKFDKTGGEVKGQITVAGLITAKDGTIQAKSAQAEGYIQISTSNDGSEAMLNSKRPSSSWRKHLLPDANGTLMQVGDYGFGGYMHGLEYLTAEQIASKFQTAVTQVWRNQQETTQYSARYGASLYVRASDAFWNMNVNHASGEITLTSGLTGNVPANFKIGKFYTTLNTTKDSNGNLKAASPIVKVFSDHIELNEESEGVELEKLGTGRYKLKGVLGMNSDASWGGIHGGMVIPNGINNLPLVWGSFDVLPDGDIIIETRYRKHELNERQEAERLMTYPEFLKDELVEVDTEEGKKEKLLKVEREDYEYCDIPNGHWIDVRVNMPSSSIYNLKQAEAERLAKEAAEKQAEEDAKGAAEKAEQVSDI
ncbi:cell envelope integrity protein TolA [Providencia manganoxydans]|uniref:cell envelope integrity protein TolA n=1 Tax=Providencia manganoxydans TaxID=2923283 RepID=UPI0032DA5407